MTQYPLGAEVTVAAISDDPYPIFARLQEAEPITWLPALNMWYVTRYQDARAIMFDTEHFVTGTDHSLIYQTFGYHMLTAEGADHERYKAAARKTFMPKFIRENLEAGITRLADGLIDGFAAAGEVELRRAFAARLPVQVMLMLFGLPPEEEKHLRVWYDSFEAALANFTHDPDVTAAAQHNVKAFHALLTKYMAKVRAAPDDSLLSALVNATGDNRLNDDEIRRNASIILFGGISTVEALILNLFYVFYRFPDVYAEVRRDPEIIPDVIEETMRWLSPVQSATRHVVKEVTVSGVTFKAGDTVNCMLGAANHDPAVFANPDVFDWRRKNVRDHVGFAVGPHHCLGSHLAKAEGRIAITRLLTRLPDLRVDDTKPPRVEGYEFRQPRALYVKWDAVTSRMVR
jgi:cytochrome P450